MKDIDEMKLLTDEMAAQYKTVKGPSEQYEAIEGTCTAVKTFAIFFAINRRR